VAVGVDPAQVTDVIISHMHYDHAGNHRDVSARPLPPADRGDGFLHRQPDVPQHAVPVRRTRCAERWWAKLFAGSVAVARRNCGAGAGVTLHRVGGQRAGCKSCASTPEGWVVLAFGRGAFLRQLARSGGHFRWSTMSRAYLDDLKRSGAGRFAEHVIQVHGSLVLARYPGHRRLANRGACGSRPRSSGEAVEFRERGTI